MQANARRSGWMAMLCAGGCIWLALNLAKSDEHGDTTGATISDDQANSFAHR